MGKKSKQKEIFRITIIIITGCIINMYFEEKEIIHKSNMFSLC
jgi:hypothetical protein